MKEYFINIQLFAAGEVVNATTSENLSAEMKTFYDKTAKSNKTYKYKVRACNKKNLLKVSGSYSKAVTLKK